MSDRTALRRALISVSDKKGIVEFSRKLTELGVELISTGGTASLLRDNGMTVTEVASVTGFPEMMDGRVKTLHPKIHGGLLALRDNSDHLNSLNLYDIPAIDLLVVSLYPFEETVARGGDFSACVENIDIGGPAMIRAAAKNHQFVTVVTEPEDYQSVLNEAAEGGVTLDLRKRLAGQAFLRTASYDAAVAQWFAHDVPDRLASRFVASGEKSQTLRYGENPHQTAALYKSLAHRPGVATANQIQGKELSYNNLNDTDAAFELVAELPSDEPAAVIVKHANPCGAAVAGTLNEAYRLALRCDPVSAFGGIVAFNHPLDVETASSLVEIFTEVIIAPDATEDAKSILAQKKNLRLLITHEMPNASDTGQVVRQIAGGFLVQDRDSRTLQDDDLRVVSKRAPTNAELNDLLFAFTVAKHVKSNAIVYAKDRATVGIGAGQMNRLDSSRIAARKSADAAEKAGECTPLSQGSVVASDAFFPFADGLLAAAEAGATAVIQPGGSIRDEEVIAAADDAGLAMVFTGVRHFRH
ncbi:MAG: bifunctional phosphoribosylaminoimidazolecarboxamide formyltransferase/IMP cyclohydrolase [Pseudomonadota bacterium]